MRTSLALTLVVLGLSACGLGTEVGNGLKPQGEGTGAGNSGTQQPGTPVDTQSSPGEQADNSPAASSAASTNGTDKLNPAQAVVFKVDALVANCGSPFAGNLATPVSLTKVGNTQIGAVDLQAQFDTTKNAWFLSNSQGTLSTTVSKTTADTPWAVHAVDSAGQAQGSGFTCSTVATSENVTLAGITGTFTKRVVELKDQTGTTELTWYVRPGKAGAPDTLIRIILDGQAVQGAGSIILDSRSNNFPVP